MADEGGTVEPEYEVSDIGTLLREDPDPDATKPTGMCGSSKKCERCPSTFLCFMKAKGEAEIIAKRQQSGRGR
jgi:hypothetical protein